MTEINEEYMIGFKDGLKLKIGDELLPMIEKILVGVSDEMKSFIPLMIDSMEIKANLDSNDWIPCSERTPDENSDEWCVGITSTGRCIAFISKNAYENDIGGVSVPTYFNHGSPITHWIPLPPKEGDANE